MRSAYGSVGILIGFLLAAAFCVIAILSIQTLFNTYRVPGGALWLGLMTLGGVMGWRGGVALHDTPPVVGHAAARVAKIATACFVSWVTLVLAYVWIIDPFDDRWYSHDLLHAITAHSADLARWLIGVPMVALAIGGILWVAFRAAK